MRKQVSTDRRIVNVQLTKTGRSLLARLAVMHYREIRRLAPEIVNALRRLKMNMRHFNGKDAWHANTRKVRRSVPLQPGAAMFASELKNRADGNDTVWINVLMGHVVVTLDVLEVYRFRNTIMLIQIHQVALQVRVIEDTPQTTFKVDIVDNIESNESAE